MPESACATCKIRAKADRNPASLVGRLWRWHAGWCPGFKSYMRSLPATDRRTLAERYNLRKYM